MADCVGNFITRSRRQKKTGRAAPPVHVAPEEGCPGRLAGGPPGTGTMVGGPEETTMEGNVGLGGKFRRLLTRAATAHGMRAGAFVPEKIEW